MKISPCISSVARNTRLFFTLLLWKHFKTYNWITTTAVYYENESSGQQENFHISYDTHLSNTDLITLVLSTIRSSSRYLSKPPTTCYHNNSVTEDNLQWKSRVKQIWLQIRFTTIPLKLSPCLWRYKNVSQNGTIGWTCASGVSLPEKTSPYMYFIYVFCILLFSGCWWARLRHRFRGLTLPRIIFISRITFFCYYVTLVLPDYCIVANYFLFHWLSLIHVGCYCHIYTWLYLSIVICN